MQSTGNRRQWKVTLIVTIALIVGILVAFEYWVQINNNNYQARTTAQVVIEQVEDLIENADARERILTETLKENYIIRAKAVSYILDKMPALEQEREELILMAELMSVDEIHLFNTRGEIYGGTVPRYYGYSFDSGEQMGYFKPMLDKEWEMCQDLTPNTAEAKPMMYAIVWNDARTRMVQVGIEPVRLMNELRSSEISEMIGHLPTYDGIEILVGDAETGEVLGSTLPRYEHRTFRELGAMPADGSDVSADEVRFFTSEHLDGYQCSIKAYQDYLILVMQEKSQINSQLPANMYMTLLYLFVAGAVIYVVVYKMTTQIIEEHKSANTDALTELQNRRAYELTLKELQKATPEQKKNVTYISMDANGLKNINDHYGHDAGDAVITGVADCIRQSFGDENAYRIGGDEYAILYRGTTADLRKAKAIFEEKVKDWNEMHPFKLTISVGYVDWAEYPESDIMEVCKLADFRMYMEKEQYYSEEGHDRRKNGPGN